MIELRPRPQNGPLGFVRPTRIHMQDGELTIYDVRGNRIALPGAHVLVPYAVRAKRGMPGLLVLDDAGRVMAGMDGDFDPYEVAAFAKEYGLNLRIQDLASRRELTDRFRPAPGFRVIQVYSLRVLWELLGLIFIGIILVTLGRQLAIVLAPTFGLTKNAQQITLEIIGGGLGLLLALRTGYLVTALRNLLRKKGRK